MTARLPDAKFFQQAEDNGRFSLIQVCYSRGGGDKSYYLVSSAAELAELVCKLPPQARVSIMDVGNHLPWQDTVYMADADGNCKPGAY